MKNTIWLSSALNASLPPTSPTSSTSYIDHAGDSDMGCCGQKNFKTPNVNVLAA